MTLTILSDTVTGESQAGIRHNSELRFRGSSSFDTVNMDPLSLKHLINTNFKELQGIVLRHLLESGMQKEALVKSKEHFRAVIGRKRDFDRIRDFEGLFNILKKRDELSYNKLEPFKLTSNIIGDIHLKEKISKFEEKFQGIEFKDLYENGKFRSPKENRLEGTFLEAENTENDRLISGNRGSSLRDGEENSFFNKNGFEILSEGANSGLFEGKKNVTGSRRKQSNFKSCVQMNCTYILVFWIFLGIALLASIFLRFTATTLGHENNLQSQGAHSSQVRSLTNLTRHQPHTSTTETEMGNRVLNRISDRIGSKWRDLARSLDIREFQIDALDAKYPRDLKEKAYQVLEIARSESDPRRWKSNLMRALVKARRKDLSDWVDENYHED